MRTYVRTYVRMYVFVYGVAYLWLMITHYARHISDFRTLVFEVLRIDELLSCRFSTVIFGYLETNRCTGVT